jgi:hypothetical protein
MVEETWAAARDLFPKVAEPIGMYEQIAPAEFARVYEGEGDNEPRTPVGEVSRRARRLALFAVTLGPRICTEIQGKLFEFLRPREIGITLRESYLMDPLKSVSGVVLVGPREIHEFEMDYSFCAECRTPSCRARINTIPER